MFAEVQTVQDAVEVEVQQDLMVVEDEGEADPQMSDPMGQLIIATLPLETI